MSFYFSFSFIYLFFEKGVGLHVNMTNNQQRFSTIKIPSEIISHWLIKYVHPAGSIKSFFKV
jgi:hypothetical protein